MLLHFFPGLSFSFVFTIFELLDLLDVMPTMRQEEALHRVFRQMWIGFAQKARDLLSICRQGLSRRRLSARIAGNCREKIGLHSAVVTRQKLEKAVLGCRTVKRFNRR